jgi:hypothetical protein
MIVATSYNPVENRRQIRVTKVTKNKQSDWSDYTDLLERREPIPL